MLPATSVLISEQYPRQYQRPCRRCIGGVREPGFTETIVFLHTNPYILKVTSYNADGHISSLDHLCITEQQNFRLSYPAAAALVPRAIPT